MKEVNIYIQMDSTCPRRLKRRYGYLMEYEKCKGTFHKKGETGEIKGTLHQTTLTAINKALERMSMFCIVHIYAEDIFVCGMFSSEMDKWAANGWKTDKDSEVANSGEWRQLWKLTRGHLVQMIQGKHKYTEWLKAKMKEEKLCKF